MEMTSLRTVNHFAVKIFFKQLMSVYITNSSLSMSATPTTQLNVIDYGSQFLCLNFKDFTIHVRNSCRGKIPADVNTRI